MSYNCNRWKTKELENLRIPVESLHQCTGSDWCMERVDLDDGCVEFRIMDSWIRGMVEDGILIVSTIKASGEGSGTVLRRIFEPALKRSTGKLVASCVWEGGDSINRITVEDGKVSWEDIEI